MKNNKLVNSENTLKTHFKMYKTNKGWMVAGITTAIFGVGLMRSQTVAADTNDAPDQSALVNQKQSSAASNSQQGNTVDDSKADEDNQPGTSEPSTSSNPQTDSSKSTKEQSPSAAISSSASADASATEGAAKTTTNGQQETVSQPTKFKTSSLAEVRPAPEPVPAPSPEPTPDPAKPAGTATATIDGQSSLTQSYQGITSPNPDDGSKNDATIKVSANNVVAGNVVTVSVPDFMRIFSTVPIQNTTMTMNADKTAVSYTANANLPTLVNFDVHMQAVTPTQPGAVQQGNVTVAVSDAQNASVNEVTMPVTASYKVADLQKGSPTLNVFASKDNPKNVQQNQDFESSIYVFHMENLAPSNLNSYSFNIPVPAGYQLNAAASLQMIQQNATYNPKSWTISQNGVGGDVVIALDKSQVAGDAVVTPPDFAWFVGKMTGTATGQQTAAQAATATISTKFGDSTATFPKFSVNVAADNTNPLVYGTKSDTVFIGPTDVNQFNFMTSDPLNIISNTNDLISPEFTFGVPTGTATTGIRLTIPSNALVMGEAATVTAFDQDGNQIATTSTTGMLPDSSGNYVWVPANVNTVASYKVTYNKLVNGTFGTTAVTPMLTVNNAVSQPTKVTIPVNINDGVSAPSTIDYHVTLTSSHLLTGFTNPHLDSIANHSQYFHPGDIATAKGQTPSVNTVTTDATVSYYPFDNRSIPTYNMLDDQAVMYLPIPNDTTYVSNSKFNANSTAIRDGNQNYVRIVIPAGTPVTTSANLKYNSVAAVTVNDGSINARINDDVTPLTKIAIPDASVAPMFIGIKNNQLDTNGWKTWTLQDIRDLGYGEIADQLQQAGYTEAYSEITRNKPTLTGGEQWPISVATSVTLDTRIKAGDDQQYVEGDGSTGVATFYPTTGATTGSIRVYVGNGGDSNLQQYTGLIDLPKSEDGADYSLNLQGQISVPANYRVQYSLNNVKGTDGSALTAEQLAQFADTQTDYSKVKSILITANNVEKGKPQQVIIPVAIDANAPAGLTANATAFNYAMNGTDVLGAKTTQLPTRTSAAQQHITINYLTNDANRKPVSIAKDVVADPGSTITLYAPIVTGYKVHGDATVSLTLTPGTTSYDFFYDPQAVAANVYFINSLTNAKIQDPISISGMVGSAIDLSSYNTLAGYTASAQNPSSYTFTTASAQPINLFFTPDAAQLTVNYVDQNNVALVPAKTFGVLVGSEYSLTAATVEGYTPDSTDQKYTVKDVNSSYTFKYTRDTVPVTIKYVLGDSDSGQEIQSATTGKSAPTGTTTNYSAPATITNPSGPINRYYLLEMDKNGASVTPDYGSKTPEVIYFHYGYVEEMSTPPIHFSKVIKRTIHYQYSDGSIPTDVNGQPLKDYDQPATLTGNGPDSKHIAWNPTSFQPVTVPVVSGATPNMTTVPKLIVLDDAPVKVTVIYTRNPITGGNGTGNNGGTNPGNGTGAGNDTNPNTNSNTNNVTNTNTNTNTGTNTDTIPNTDLPSTFGGVDNGTHQGSGVANSHSQNVDHNSNDGHGGLPNTFNAEGSQNGQASTNVAAGSASAQTQSGSNAFRNGQNGRQATLPQTGDGDASKTGLFGLVMLALTGLGALLPNRRKN
ncbi:KxYKxGKxW signal peptide domain-containing protein [Lacticaseibacillus pabuli]|uniref:KxYKxGKxW signal peptide domain-containing protein n=1 Tax=Lacticaseibacillus pabuli TaxID=3025672 RepID=A0ABY7WRJ6_9LACO|nr:MucBP domain-containing protein [Lacticaseibacillus sp. KACC 23028]WDF81637.1 KxYKxGKxW signal peptide domain-containing protein [Lacticaseibacillus sp. KACC 23028]